MERGFAWLGRDRRSDKNHGAEVWTSETLIEDAAIRLMPDRIALTQMFR